MIYIIAIVVGFVYFPTVTAWVLGIWVVLVVLYLMADSHEKGMRDRAYAEAIEADRVSKLTPAELEAEEAVRNKAARMEWIKVGVMVTAYAVGIYCAIAFA